MIASSARFTTDERGAIAPLAAVMMTALVGLGGLAVDAGVWYVKRRSLQQATDVAAMAAVSHTGSATAVAGDMLARNGFAASDLVSVETGYYCADAGLAPAARFTTSACPTGSVTPAAPNAVRVTARSTAPQFLSAAIGAAPPAAGVRAQAVAARIDEAGLEIRSGLVSADLALANATLQSLLGGSGLSLTAAQYDGLIGANVDALGLFDKLATNAGITAGSYGSVLNTSVKVTDLLQAAADVLTAQNVFVDTTGAVAGLQAVKAKVTGNPSISIGALFDLGVWKNETVGASGSPTALKAGVNAYQLVAFALQIANGSHAAAVPTTGLGIPGLAGATIQAVAIEPPQSSYFAFGPEGVSVHTAQVRMKLTLQLLDSRLVALPLYIEVASGTATLADMDCGADPATDAWARVRAQTGAVNVYLGSVPNSVMTGFGTPTPYTSVAAVPIIDAGLVQLKAKSRVSAGASTATDLMFYPAPANGVVPGGALGATGYMARIGSSTGQIASKGKAAEVVASSVVSGLTSNLFGNMSNIELCIAGICSGSVTGLAATLLSTVVQPLLNGLDPLLDGLLKGLGVKLGRAEVAVTGLRCGVPVIVS
jgi:uncharacterized membrane protein